MPSLWDDIVALFGGGSLHKAVRKQDHQTIRALGRRSPKKLAKRDSDGMTPLHLAVELGYLPMVQTLLDAGISDSPGRCLPSEGPVQGTDAGDRMIDSSIGAPGSVQRRGPTSEDGDDGGD